MDGGGLAGVPENELSQAKDWLIVGTLGVGFLAMGYRFLAWFFGHSVRLHDLETRATLSEQRLESGSTEIRETHDAVTTLCVKIESLSKGQDQILERVNLCQLRNRGSDECPPNVG